MFFYPIDKKVNSTYDTIIWTFRQWTFHSSYIYIYIYIYIYKWSSDSTVIFDPLSPSVSIVDRSWQVLPKTSNVRSGLMNIGICRSANPGVSTYGIPQENFIKWFRLCIPIIAKHSWFGLFECFVKWEMSSRTHLWDAASRICSKHLTVSYLNFTPSPFLKLFLVHLYNSTDTALAKEKPSVSF